MPPFIRLETLSIYLSKTCKSNRILSENKIHVFEVASTVLFVRDLQLSRDTGTNSKFRLHNESLHKPEVADYKINRLIIPSLLWILWKLKREENKDMKVTMRNNRQSFWHLYC